MKQIPDSELSFAPRFRPFHLTDVEEYSIALDSLICPGTLQARCPSPAMSLTACRLVGGGYAVDFDSSPFEVEHKAAHLSRSGDDVLVTIAIKGAGAIEQAGRQLPFSQGDIAFRTTRMPSTSSLLTPGHVLALRLPSARFFSIHADLSDRFVPTVVRSDSPLVIAAREHLAHVFPELPQLRAASAFFVEQSYVSLLAAIYCDSVPKTSPKVNPCDLDSWRLLAAYIEANLCDPLLSVEKIARDLRISRRLLHRRFEVQNIRYSAYLRMRRLERAHGELNNSRLVHLTVSEIAYRNGFNDSSHFNRCFRQYFGVPPGTYRKTIAAATDPISRPLETQAC